MHTISLPIAIAAFAALAAAVPAPPTSKSTSAAGNPSGLDDGLVPEYRVHERWTKHHKLAPHVKLPLRIGLTQQNPDLAVAILRNVSDPDSPRYGQYLSAQEVIDLSSPSNDSITTVSQWLQDGGFGAGRIRLSPTRKWITVSDASVHEVENLLQAKYWAWRDGNGRKAVGVDQYMVPEHVKEHVDLIRPIFQSGRDRSNQQKSKRSAVHSRRDNAPRHRRQEEEEDCSTSVSIPCLKAMYNITSDPLIPHPNNSLGIYALQMGGFSQADLDLFWTSEQTGSPVENGTSPDVVYFPDSEAAVLPFLWDGDLGEGNMDLQLSMSLTDPLPVTFFQTGLGYNDTEMTETNLATSMFDFFDAMACGEFESADDEPADDEPADASPADPDVPDYCISPPRVLSMSYGLDEFIEAEGNFELAAANIWVCGEILKLGLRGVSVVVSSGDSGDGKGGHCGFSGSYPFGKIGASSPASCPWAISVGGTVLPPNASVHDTQEVWTNEDVPAASGGGYSDLFSVPWYQNDALAYYSVDSEGQPLRDPTSLAMRGFPDLAAMADSILVYERGRLSNLGQGTSAAAPIVASILALINNERLTANKSTVGFINPALYKFPWVLNDVVDGTNIGCGTDGYDAAEGWDPATGLGTPDYQKMRDLWMSFQ